MNILIMDGQGGRLGSLLVEAIRQRFPQVYLSAVGTNAMAAAAMKKAGAHQAASGENPTLVACRKADVIIGPIGIVIADALFGEVTPRMAAAVGQALRSAFSVLCEQPPRASRPSVPAKAGPRAEQL